MKLSDVVAYKICEAAYPGNIGAMEVFTFFKSANSDEKDQFNQYISNKDFDNAWDLLQSVTGVKLHPMDVNERATIFSNPITHITINNGKRDRTFPVLQSVMKSDNWGIKVNGKKGPVWLIVNEQTNKVYTESNKRIRFVGALVALERDTEAA